MLIRSQPLDSQYSEKYKSQLEESEEMTERNIQSQRIGQLFDDMDFDSECSFCFKRWIIWKYRDVRDFYYDSKYAIRNYRIWRKTINSLRPWDGFSGLISVMQTHLKDYIETEEKYGHSARDFKNQKIASAKETVELLERMKEPHEYTSRRRAEVDAKYPEYKSLITEYKNGGVSSSGRFVALGQGWVGMESGRNPREGYFEFVNGIFELTTSPDQHETDRLLDELRKYNESIDAAYMLAEIDSDKDFERLSVLLKENLYSWWD